MRRNTTESLRVKLNERRIYSSHTGCWLWPGKKIGGGYGAIRVHGRYESVHRVAMFLWCGFDLKSSSWVLHKCDTPACYNPLHLYVGTPEDNVADMYDRDRQRGPVDRGSQHFKAKLDEDAVREIRRLAHLKVPTSEIARQFNVSRYTIWEVVSIRTWKSVE